VTPYKRPQKEGFIMKAYNIEWDTDGNLKLLNSLPKEIEIPKDIENDIDLISDYISNVTEFCHFCFKLKK